MLDVFGESIIIGLVAVIAGILIMFLYVKFAGKADINSLFMIVGVDLFVTGFISHFSAFLIACRMAEAAKTAFLPAPFN